MCFCFALLLLLRLAWRGMGNGWKDSGKFLLPLGDLLLLLAARDVFCGLVETLQLSFCCANSFLIFLPHSDLLELAGIEAGSADKTHKFLSKKTKEFST